MRARLTRSTVLAFLTAFVLLILVLANVRVVSKFASLRSSARAQRATEQAALQVLSDLRDAETAQRGFLLTGHKDYLEPFEQGRLAIGPALALLQAGAVEPEQRERVQRLSGLVQKKMAELQDTVELMRAGRREAALAIVEGDDGRRLMGSVRGVVDELTGAARDVLATRQDELRANVNVAFVVDGVAGAVALLLTVLVGGIDRDLRRRQELELELRGSVAREHEARVAANLSREWFETTLHSIADAVIATDRAGAVTFMNAVAQELTGWSLDEARGRPLAEVFAIVDAETRARVERPVERVLHEGAVILMRRGGGEVAIDDSAAPIRGGDGELAGVVLVFRDVGVGRRDDDRRAFLARASAELASTLDYRATLATITRLAVPAIADWCAVDMLEDGVLKRLAVAHVDPEKVRLVEEIERRYPPDPNAPHGVPNILRTGQPELVGDITPDLLDALTIDDGHRELARALSLKSFLGVPIVRGERVLGVISLVMAESNRHYNESDFEMAVLLADRAAVTIENARLLAESRRAQERADVDRAEAELANRTKDEFLAILGHELRNPLAPIVTALQIMKMRGGDEHERERTVIERQVKHMVRLVDDLLDISRITRGKVELAREPVEISETVQKAIEMASPLLEGRRHDVTVSVPRQLWVLGDEVRLAQVVANLLNNAAKYSEPSSKITIEAARANHDGRSEVVLRVRDRGMGIAPEMLPRVFELFVQEQQALDRAHAGAAPRRHHHRAQRRPRARQRVRGAAARARGVGGRGAGARHRRGERRGGAAASRRGARAGGRR